MLGCQKRDFLAITSKMLSIFIDSMQVNKKLLPTLMSTDLAYNVIYKKLDASRSTLFNSITPIKDAGLEKK